MDKAKAIELLKLLAALESWSFSQGQTLPEYLHDNLGNLVHWLKEEILK